MNQEYRDKIDILTVIPNEDIRSIIDSEPFRIVPEAEARNMLIDDLNTE